MYVPNWASPIDLMWDHPLLARFLTRLASFSRLILFDKRGSGSSDNVSIDALATVEDWTDDIATVMDAVGSERAALVGATVGCPIAMLFAATRPERTSALVLINASARRLADSDYPGVDPERADDLTADFRSAWGTDAVMRARRAEHGRRRSVPALVHALLPSRQPTDMAAAVFPPILPRTSARRSR